MSEHVEKTIQELTFRIGQLQDTLNGLYRLKDMTARETQPAKTSPKAAAPALNVVNKKAKGKVAKSRAVKRSGDNQGEMDGRFTGALAEAGFAVRQSQRRPGLE